MNALDEAVKSIHAIKLQFLSARLSLSCLAKWKDIITYLHLHTKWYFEEEHSCYYLSSSWINCMSLWIFFTSKNNCGGQLVSSDVVVWQALFHKWMEWPCHFKENNWKYLFSMVKFCLLSTKDNFRTFYLPISF